MTRHSGRSATVRRGGRELGGAPLAIVEGVGGFVENEVSDAASLGSEVRGRDEALRPFAEPDDRRATRPRRSSGRGSPGPRPQVLIDEAARQTPPVPGFTITLLLPAPLPTD